MKAVLAPPRSNARHPRRSSTRRPSVRSQTQSTPKHNPPSPFNRPAFRRSYRVTGRIPLNRFAQPISAQSHTAPAALKSP
jgi:hypothetical protein